jgi:transposase
MTKSAKKYPKEFKQEAVSLALKSPSIVNTAKELNIPAATLYTWMHQLKKENPVKKATTDIDSKNNMATLLEENRRLHKELTIAREEKEILKKAAAYFAQHQK